MCAMATGSDANSILKHLTAANGRDKREGRTVPALFRAAGLMVPEPSASSFPNPFIGTGTECDAEYMRSVVMVVVCEGPVCDVRCKRVGWKSWQPGSRALIQAIATDGNACSKDAGWLICQDSQCGWELKVVDAHRQVSELEKDEPVG